MNVAAEHARGMVSKAKHGHEKDAVGRAGRFGFAARGVLYLIVAALAAQLAFGSNDEPADKHGALQALAGHPLGMALLVVLTVGFASFAAWRATVAVTGRSVKGAGGRASAAGKAVIYAVAAATAASTLLGEEGGDSNEQSRTLTARVLEWPGGRAVVAIVGLAIAAAGVAIAVRGLLRRFEKKMKLGEMPDGLRTPAAVLGVVGHAARGVVATLLGLLLVRAAAHRAPDEAQGIDGTLRTIAAQPYGRALLLVAAAGLACFGLHSLIQAKYRRT